MKIIPVIDLKDGQVVHARFGQRDAYPPINSPLCASADIFEVINTFLSVYAFDTFYIADLNAITGKGHHNDLINQVLAVFPDRIFWLDCGYQRYKPLPANALPVLGSECYLPDQLIELADFNKNFILSLDYSKAGSLGALELFNGTTYWPDNIIIMTLDRVGSQQGVDAEKLVRFCKSYPDKQFIAAGGIRHVEDLLALQEMGIHYALVASALHTKTIGQIEIEKLQTKKYPG